jgi:hypothetical protein
MPLMTDDEIKVAVAAQQKENRAKGLTHCKCNNWYKDTLTECPKCHRFNEHIKEGNCPFCDKPFNEGKK